MNNELRYHQTLVRMAHQHTPKQAPEEAMKCIAARVQIAADALDAGRIEDALVVLRALQRILPTPMDRHFEADQRS